MPKRLAVFLDGTWNKPDSNTNVWRLKTLVAPTDEHGTAQLAWYDTGVGTAWSDRVRGGALGLGLDTNIRQAYQWLVEQYEPKDEIFLFGFSRGAYTARSLAGLIVRCGLLWPGASINVPRLFERYRLRSAAPLWDIVRRRYRSEPISADEQYLLANVRQVRIRTIGVWDTVGALGIPFGNVPGLGRKAFQFHHTRPSNRFDNLFHAVAVDEHRKDYEASLWTRFVPDSGSPAAAPTDGDDGDDTDTDTEQPAARTVRGPQVEQRWFAGAHANVGGGYEDDALASIPLAWLQQKAEATGLRFRRRVQPGPDDHRAAIVDSFKEFLGGLYRIVRLNRRYYRPIAIGMHPTRAADGTPGQAGPFNETVDASVIRRWQEDQSYRPPNLRDWAKRRGVSLDTIDPATWTG
ncbi:MAG: DUF2235 domain-containing protein [Gemmatimonadales bacterium]|nr:DUF2235 domain-containing protein [Gemmatimonadales bacterium]